MTNVSIGWPIPILRIFDEPKAREFYLDFLGYALDWEHGGGNFPRYIQISQGSCTLHLSEHHGDACPGAAVRIPVKDIEEWHKKLIEKEYKYMKPGIEDTPWNTREVKVTDPFGNRLIFFSSVS
ncbi:MAG: glyoxalase superfamily protein [Bacillota bacterium]